MSLSQYDPFDVLMPRTMREAMDRLLEQGFAPAWGTDILAVGRGFPIDVYEDELNYVIEASLPGIKPDDLKVTATDSSVTIRANTSYDEKQQKKAEPKETKAGKEKAGVYVRRERYIGEVVRVVDLPEPINPAKIKASYKHGVLTLEAPKVGEAKPRTIQIAVEE